MRKNTKQKKNDVEKMIKFIVIGPGKTNPIRIQFGLKIVGNIHMYDEIKCLTKTTEDSNRTTVTNRAFVKTGTMTGVFSMQQEMCARTN
jgi:hypothetical protein